MIDQTQAKKSWLERLNLLIGIAVGLTSIATFLGFKFAEDRQDKRVSFYITTLTNNIPVEQRTALAPFFNNLRQGLQGSLPDVQKQADAAARNLTSAAACPDLTGKWETPGFTLDLTMTGCSVSSTNMDNGGFHHTISAIWQPSQGGYVWTITRIARSSNCLTHLYGNASFLTNDLIVSHTSRTDGTCGLAASYSEDRNYHRLGDVAR